MKIFAYIINGKFPIIYVPRSFDDNFAMGGKYTMTVTWSILSKLNDKRLHYENEIATLQSNFDEKLSQVTQRYKRLKKDKTTSKNNYETVLKNLAIKQTTSNNELQK